MIHIHLTNNINIPCNLLQRILWFSYQKKKNLFFFDAKKRSQSHWWSSFCLYLFTNSEILVVYSEFSMYVHASRIVMKADQTEYRSYRFLKEEKAEEKKDFFWFRQKFIQKKFFSTQAKWKDKKFYFNLNNSFRYVRCQVLVLINDFCVWKMLIDLIISVALIKQPTSFSVRLFIREETQTKRREDKKNWRKTKKRSGNVSIVLEA